MFARWLPFVSGIILQFIFVGFGFYVLLARRAMSLTSSINLEHCATQGLERFQHSVELCAHETAISYMNEPHFLARMFTILLTAAITIGWLTSSWGQKMNNQMMLLVGFIAAAMVLMGLDRAILAAIAILLGQSLGWLFASRK